MKARRPLATDKLENVRYTIGGGFLKGYTVVDNETKTTVKDNLGMWEAITLRDNLNTGGTS